jgi:hypothetical protein
MGNRYWGVGNGDEQQVGEMLGEGDVRDSAFACCACNNVFACVFCCFWEWPFGYILYATLL